MSSLLLDESGENCCTFIAGTGLSISVHDDGLHIVADAGVQLTMRLDENGEYVVAAMQGDTGIATRGC